MMKAKLRMWIPDKSPGGRMVFRGIYDLHWYTHPTQSRLYREIRQRDHQFPLMFFTGMKDKTNKDIYQSDIVRFQEINGEEPEIDIGVIEWVEKCAAFGINWVSSANGLQPLDEVEVEIIGNIYENPEILNFH